jgi:YHS domain-containing protein
MRLFVTFWAVMSAAGLITELLFDGLGWVPQAGHGEVVHSRFAWNYTTFLNIVFLGVFGVLYWLYRNRARLGGGKSYAIDPICGMQVQISNAPASTVRDGKRVYFCSDHCRERFERNAPPTIDSARDPICGMDVDKYSPGATRVHDGSMYFFCCEGCAQTFDSDPAGYAAGMSSGQHEGGHHA